MGKAPNKKQSAAAAKHTQDHSRGSSLADFTKPTKEFPKGLSPTEQKLLDACTRGEDCVIGDGKRPTKATKENKVRASFLRYLILGGCEKTPSVLRGIRLVGAYIDCVDEIFDLAAVTITQDVQIKNCHIAGSIHLTGSSAKIITLSGSLVDEVAADGLITDGSLRLRNGFVTNGLVRLLNANIGGNINCDGAVFHNKNQCLNAARSTINGDVVLGKINSAGTVSFLGAKVFGDFSVSNAVLLGSKALNLRGAKIDGVLHWHPRFINGEVNFAGAHANIINMGEEQWMRKRVDYALKYNDVLAECFPDLAPKERQEKNGEAVLVEPSEATPEEEQKPKLEFATKIDNFTYQGFADPPKSSNANFWIEWIEQMPSDHLTTDFRPKPWGQLAGVLESMGYEAEAKSVRIGKEKHLTDFMAEHEPAAKIKFNPMHKLNVMWRRVTGFLVDYGYSPGKAVLYLAMLMMLGTFVYSGAARKGIMTPTHPLIFKEAITGFIPKECAENWVYFPKEIEAKCADAVPSEYSEFQALIYSADVLLPVVNLRMESDWSPRVVNTDGSPNRFGWWVRTFEWLLIISGWILSLLFVSAVGGIIRR